MSCKMICTTSPFKTRSTCILGMVEQQALKTFHIFPIGFARVNFPHQKCGQFRPSLNSMRSSKRKYSWDPRRDGMKTIPNTNLYTFELKRSFFVEMTLLKIQTIQCEFTLKIKEVSHPETNMDACCEYILFQTAVHQNDLF